MNSRPRDPGPGGRWLSSSARPRATLFLVALLLVAPGCLVPASASEEADAPGEPAGAELAQPPLAGEEALEHRLQHLDRAALEEEMLRLEVLKLQAGIDSDRAWWTPLVRLAPFITAMVGLAGAFIGL